MMSWYQDKVHDFYTSNPKGPQEIAVTIIITDMNTANDRDKIAAALLSIPGVTRVDPLPQQKKLIVVYDTVRTTPEFISYTIGRLGYHLLPRG